MLFNQGSWVLTVPKVGSIGTPLVHEVVVLGADPGDEIVAGLEWWSPTLTKEGVVLRLESLLHRNLLSQSGLVEVVRSISDGRLPHLRLESRLIIFNLEAFSLLSFIADGVVSVINRFTVVFLRVSLHFLESALNRVFKLSLEDLVFSVLLQLFV